MLSAEIFIAIKKAIDGALKVFIYVKGIPSKTYDFIPS